MQKCIKTTALTCYGCVENKQDVYARSKYCQNKKAKKPVENKKDAEEDADGSPPIPCIHFDLAFGSTCASILVFKPMFIQTCDRSMDAENSSRECQFYLSF